jgi:hypothetical protein
LVSYQKLALEPAGRWQRSVFAAGASRIRRAEEAVGAGMNGFLLKVVVAIYVLTALAVVTAGGVYVHKVDSGIRAVATVDDCITVPAVHSVTYDCSGSWVIGGPLLAGGRVVVGSVVGASPRDLHRAIPVRVSGGTAYVRSLKTGVVLIATGVAALLLPASGVMARRSRARRISAGQSGLAGSRP